MRRIVPPNLLPSLRCFLVLQVSANRLGHTKATMPWVDICDPAVAKDRVIERCAKYGDVGNEIDELIAEITNGLDAIERMAVPMVGNSTLCEVEYAVAALLRQRGMAPVEVLAKRLTLYAEILYLRTLIDKRDESSDRY